MFNPELKGIYSPIVEKELIKLADYFELKNVQAYILGIVGTDNLITAPMCIFTDEVNKKYKEVIWECYNSYTAKLSAAEEEKIGTLIYLSTDSILDEDNGKEIALWVK